MGHGMVCSVCKSSRHVKYCTLSCVMCCGGGGLANPRNPGDKGKDLFDLQQNKVCILVQTGTYVISSVLIILLVYQREKVHL